MIKQLLSGIVMLALCANAFGFCNKRDIQGSWSVVINDVDEVVRCYIAFKSNATVAANASSCTIYDRLSAGTSPNNITGGALTAKQTTSGCTVTGTITDADGSTNVVGYLSRDGNLMIGILSYPPDGNSDFTAVKAK